jgi:hypothetical protein
MCVGAPVSLCVEDAFRATDFPLASVLPSIDSTGVTHVFADFNGTMTSSDFSEAYDRGVSLVAFPRLPAAPDGRRGASEISQLPDE